MRSAEQAWLWRFGVYYARVCVLILYKNYNLCNIPTRSDRALAQKDPRRVLQWVGKRVRALSIKGKTRARFWHLERF